MSQPQHWASNLNSLVTSTIPWVKPRLRHLVIPDKDIMKSTQIPNLDAKYKLADVSTFCNVTDNCTTLPNSLTPLQDVSLESIIVPCVFSIILVVGVVGNALLIMSFARHKTLSTPHNALVVNLASGDFIFLIISLPFNLLWYMFPSWPFGLVICKLSNFAEYVATTVVISTLSVLSVERCLIVTGKKLWRQQKKGPILLTISIWAISLIVSLPSLISANLSEQFINNETTNVFCFHYDENWGKTYSKIHVTIMFIFLFCIPLLIIATAYILIAVHLLLRAFPLSHRRTAAHKPKRRAEYRCCVWRKTTKVDYFDSCPQPDPIKNELQLEDKPKPEITLNKTDNDSANKLIQKTNSKSSLAKDDEKSCSPDSCTETTDLQPTPVFPCSFVYTDRIPEDTTQEAKYTKMTAVSPATEDIKDKCNDKASCANASSKETTPLNPSSSNDAKTGYRQRQQSLVTKRRRLALTVLMLIIAFSVCWTPRHVYLLWFHFFPDYDYDTFWHVFKIIGFCLSSSNSAVNPAVFYVLDTTYRSFVHRALCMVCIRLCRLKTSSTADAAVTNGERDYNATIAMTDMKSKANMTEL